MFIKGKELKGGLVLLDSLLLDFRIMAELAKIRSKGNIGVPINFAIFTFCCPFCIKTGWVPKVMVPLAKSCMIGCCLHGPTVLNLTNKIL